MKFGCTNETGIIESILLKNPASAYIDQEKLDASWRELGYTDRTDYIKALDEYKEFVDLISSSVDDIHYLPANGVTGPDSIYVRDTALITSRGAILCNMGKGQRTGEPEETGKYLSEAGIPVIGKITGDGTLEGGDVILLDDKTLIVGIGYRTNIEGVLQLEEITSEFIVNIIAVDLPHWDGPGNVFHLMSMISPIREDLAVVYSKPMPVHFREMLLYRSIKLIEVPDEEFDSMGCNILALSPDKALMVAGNPKTKALLEKEGVEVLEYKGEQISLNGGGGPTCLTRPLLRL